MQGDITNQPTDRVKREAVRLAKETTLVGVIDPVLAFNIGFDAGVEYARSADTGEAMPIDAVLFCPKCKEQHIDEANPLTCEDCGAHEGAHGTGFDNGTCPRFNPWLNPPHKKHRCHKCNHVWKAASVPTNGVDSIAPPSKQEGE